MYEEPVEEEVEPVLDPEPDLDLRDFFPLDEATDEPE